MSTDARTPEPPYWAVIFSSRRSITDPDEYAAAATRMVELASQQDGFLGVESARASDGFGITVSYWRDREAIAAWRRHDEHRIVRERGRQAWYEQFQVRIACVERAYERTQEDG